MTRFRIVPEGAGPEYGQRPRTVADDVSSLMRQVSVIPSGCWEFTGFLDKKGYARITCQGAGKILAHRAAWTLRFGDPGELCVLHRCDNPPCVNPHHLFLGTIADNNADMARKGRCHKTGPSNEAHGMCRISDAEVAALRSCAGTATQKELGVRFGISQAQVWRILHNESRVAA